jgi:hypothetical protein
MGFDEKYGTVETSHKDFYTGEPLFILRSTDLLAPEAVDDYALTCEEAHCSAEHVAMARKSANDMRTWQRENPNLVKKQPD